MATLSDSNNTDSLDNTTIVGIGTAGTPAGGVVTVQGITNGTTQPIAVNDGNSNKITSTVVASARALDVNVVQNAFGADRNITGTIAALNATVAITTIGSTNASVTITGTWVGTLTPQGSSDGTNWNNIIGMQSYGVLLGSMTTNTAIIFPVGSWQQMRVIATAWSSGTATIYINASGGIQTLAVYQFEPTSLNGTMRLKDGVGNGITSEAVSGTTLARRSLDVNALKSAQSRFYAPVTIDQTAATAANATVWSMRNASGSTKTCLIDSICLQATYDDATPLGRQTIKYALVRFSTATPTAGTAETVIKGDTTNSATVVTDVRFLATGLTTTGVAFETAFQYLAIPIVSGGPSTQFNFEDALSLAPGEGLAIRLFTTAIDGLSLTGRVGWWEL